MTRQKPRAIDLPQTVDYEAEYEELCLAMRPEYREFRRQFPAFRGGYGDYREVMQAAQDELRDRAALAALEQEAKIIRDLLLLPPIYRSGQLRVSDEFAADLASVVEPQLTLEGATTAGSGQQSSTDSTDEFSHDKQFRYCRWRDYQFTFSPLQARVIKALFEAQSRREPGLSAEALAEAAGSAEMPPSFKITRLFRGRGQAALDSKFLQKLGPIWSLNLVLKRP